MANKLTIVKVLGKGDAGPTLQDLARWRQIFSEAKDDPDFLNVISAAKSDEIQVEQVEISTENTITFVKIGDKNYVPTMKDLEAWRQIFEEGKDDPNFKIFTGASVEISIVPIGKIVAIE